MHNRSTVKKGAARATNQEATAGAQARAKALPRRPRVDRPAPAPAAPEGLAEPPAVAADLAPFIAALADLVIADLSRDPPSEPD